MQDAAAAAANSCADLDTRPTWVFGLDRTHLDADASVGKASWSGPTAALFRLVIHANARTLKTENPCAAGIHGYDGSCGE